MSHFSVLVISKTAKEVEKLLAPFQENNMGDCPKKYLQFEDLEGDYRKQYEREKGECVVGPDGKFYSPYDELFTNKNYDNCKPESETNKARTYPDGFKLKKVPFKERYKTFEKFCREYHSCGQRDRKMKRFGYWENPDKKWDWWVVGGRFTGKLKLKDGAKGYTGRPGLMTSNAEVGFCDQARHKDIDWEGMKKALQEHRAQAWDDAFRKHPGDGQAQLRSLIYGIGKDQTKEEYINSGEFSVFAVLRDGVWYEQGNMGWWGIVTKEKKPKKWRGQLQTIMNGLKPDDLLIIVDCHI